MLTRQLGALRRANGERQSTADGRPIELRLERIAGYAAADGSGFEEGRAYA